MGNRNSLVSSDLKVSELLPNCCSIKSGSVKIILHFLRSRGTAMKFFKKNDGSVSLSTIQLHASTIATQPGLLSTEDLKRMKGVIVAKPVSCMGIGVGDYGQSGFLSVVVTINFKNWNPYLHLPTEEPRTEMQIHVSLDMNQLGKLTGWVSYGIHGGSSYNKYHLTQLVGL